MSDQVHFVTGATGLLGSHIVEQLRGKGERVRALVRPGGDARFLEAQGAEVVRGGLENTEELKAALAGAGTVYNCAAKVSDWGPWAEFEREAEVGTRSLVEACKAAGVGRLLHVSSISVYGNPKVKPGELIGEDTPLGQSFRLWDYYPRAKLLAENIVREFGPNLTIVRPSWIYGPRDRVTIPRVVPALLEKRVPIIGRGDNLLNLIYAGDVARGAILAAAADQARGRVYNLCSTGEITQRDMVDTLTGQLGLPRIEKHVPFWLAMRFAFLKEAFAKLLGKKKPPAITRRAIYLIGRPTQFDIARAGRELGWRPEIGIQEGIRRSLEWFRTSGLPGSERIASA